MYEHRNGHHSWKTPSPLDILLGTLSQIQRTQSETVSRLGGLETGQRIMLDNQAASFERHNETDGRVMALETTVASLSAKPLSGPPPTEAPGLLESTKALIMALGAAAPSVTQLLMAVAVLAAAIGLIPERHAESILARIGSQIAPTISGDRAAP